MHITTALKITLLLQFCTKADFGLGLRHPPSSIYCRRYFRFFVPKQFRFFNPDGSSLNLRFLIKAVNLNLVFKHHGVYICGETLGICEWHRWNQPNLVPQLCLRYPYISLIACFRVVAVCPPYNRFFHCSLCKTKKNEVREKQTYRTTYKRL